eukprot:gnl/MRDRNA2_/MRDRNA2_20399_c0_seq1.p1 gnl/MRDRNA2_/MRDRNA2_20399_c0~~gnl/MRDRNA2_/MRDRNA2_20399_c0_seq1.p1  ORF type:complete len:294 (+),score=49.17 gnl/MRDRNA2_/MRDRNA2_20399_c0_seq1:79-882(+)
MAPLLERLLNQRCVKPTVGAAFASPWDRPALDRPAKAKSVASPLGFTVRVFDSGTKGSKQLRGEKYVQQKVMVAERSPSPEQRPSALDFDLSEVHEMLTGAKLLAASQRQEKHVLPKGVAEEWSSVETFAENGRSKRQTWDQRLLGINRKLRETKVNTLLWSFQTQKRLHEVVVLSSLKETFHAWKQFARDQAHERKRNSRVDRRSRASVSPVSDWVKRIGSIRIDRATVEKRELVGFARVATDDHDHVPRIHASFSRVLTDDHTYW